MKANNILCFLYLNWVHIGCLGDLYTPCNQLSPPDWDRDHRRYQAAALPDGHGLWLKAGMAWHSHSKRSKRSQHSLELHKKEAPTGQNKDLFTTFIQAPIIVSIQKKYNYWAVLQCMESWLQFVELVFFLSLLQTGLVCQVNRSSLLCS